MVANAPRNVFNPRPSDRSNLGGFHLRPVFSLGGSAHRDPVAAQFVGSLGQLLVWTAPLTIADAQCLYRHSSVLDAMPRGAGAQAVTFGCVDHWTAPCSYNANQVASMGAGYPEALNAFTACVEAGAVVDGFCHVELDRAAGLSNQVACQSEVSTNIGFHTTIPFTVHIAGLYRFRLHADYGNGGFIGVDGAAYLPGDVFGHVLFDDVYLEVGEHYFESLGFDGCCDGRAELEVHLPCDRRTDPWRPVVSGESTAMIPRDRGENCTADQRLEGQIVCGQTVTGTTGGEYSLFGGMAAEHLFSLSINRTQTVQFDSCASSFDTYLRVYTADLRTEVAACDDCGPCGVQTVLTVRLEAGSYTLDVEGTSSSVVGQYTVAMRCEGSPLVQATVVTLCLLLVPLCVDPLFQHAYVCVS